MPYFVISSPKFVPGILVAIITRYPEVTMARLLRQRTAHNRHAFRQWPVSVDLAAGLKAPVELNRHLSLSASVSNLLDRYYEIQKRSPMAGRSFGLSCTIEN